MEDEDEKAMQYDNDTPPTDRKDKPGEGAKTGDQPDDDDENIESQIDAKVSVKAFLFFYSFFSFLVDFIFRRLGCHFNCTPKLFLKRGLIDLAPFNTLFFPQALFFK